MSSDFANHTVVSFLETIRSGFTQLCGRSIRREGIITKKKILLSAYKLPPPALCTKAKVGKRGGIFAGHYGSNGSKHVICQLKSDEGLILSPL